MYLYYLLTLSVAFVDLVFGIRQTAPKKRNTALEFDEALHFVRAECYMFKVNLDMFKISRSNHNERLHTHIIAFFSKESRS